MLVAASLEMSFPLTAGDIVAIIVIALIVLSLLMHIMRARTAMYCRECGAKIPLDSKFCKECGTKLV
jgi:rRNA maturation endonuclease Nob1